MITVERARALRRMIERAAESLGDKDASAAAQLFPRLTGGGALVKAGTRVCYNGRVLRAAADLWDTEENNPDAAPGLWEEIGYREGERVIPETITPGLAFGKGERGWWGGELYVSLLEANVWTPQAYPDAWARVEV